jgi:hypothetical protein
MTGLTRLEELVINWRKAQLAIDAMTIEQRQRDIKPLERLVAAHNALTEYADLIIKVDPARMD